MTHINAIFVYNPWVFRNDPYPSLSPFWDGNLEDSIHRAWRNKVGEFRVRLIRASFSPWHSSLPWVQPLQRDRAEWCKPSVCTFIHLQCLTLGGCGKPWNLSGAKVLIKVRKDALVGGCGVGRGQAWLALEKATRFPQEGARKPVLSPLAPLSSSILILHTCRHWTFLGWSVPNPNG